MYQQMIRESMARQGRIAAAPAHCVEAWMRLEHGTLDALDRRQFDAEVAAGIECHRADPGASERLAESCGISDESQPAASSLAPSSADSAEKGGAL